MTATRNAYILAASAADRAAEEYVRTAMEAGECHEVAVADSADTEEGKVAVELFNALVEEEAMESDVEDADWGDIVAESLRAQGFTVYC
jgi:hypothetical protein